MPKLESVKIYNCHIHNLIGIPENISVSFQNSTIDSFEGLDFPIPRQIEDQCIRLDNCTVRSLSGISRSTIQAILLDIASKDTKSPKNSNHLEKNILELPPTAIKLIHESIDPEIESRYSPKLNPNWPSKWTEKYARLPEGHPMRLVRYDIPDYYLHEWQLYKGNYYSPQEQLQSAHKEDWIFGFDLAEKLFIPEKLDRLHEYYHKTAQQLAKEYISDSKKIQPDQTERLIHEVDPELRKMLENNLPPSDPVIKKISAKFSFEIKKEFKILK